MNVLISGASGFIGEPLSERLRDAGHRVVGISRSPQADEVGWDEDALRPAIRNADAVVHLAGENLFGKRWSDEQKKELVRSRVETTERLSRLAAEEGLGTFVGASAVGYYGPSERQGLDEDSPPGEDFLAELCTRWEAASAGLEAPGVRRCVVRFGVVLGDGGGALEKMVPPFKLGIGGPLGSGAQWVSWVHRDDVVGIIVHLLEHPELHGIFNATAPKPVTMRELAKTLGRVLHRPAVLPVPGFALRLALGEVADILLTGQHVLPEHTREAGYEFRFAQLEPALEDLLG